MLFMIIEHFHGNNPKPLYKRFQEKGRMMPEGLTYVGSWIEANFEEATPLPGTPAQAADAVVVCSDVIEHMIRPEALLAKITEPPLRRDLQQPAVDPGDLSLALRPVQGSAEGSLARAGGAF